MHFYFVHNTSRVKNDTISFVEIIRLELVGIEKRYGMRRVLRDFAFLAEGGEVVGITGANGSGKSTVLKLVAGLLRASKGELTLQIGTTNESDPARRRRLCGYVSPELALYPELSARENLRFFCDVRGVSPEGIAATLVRVGLGGREDDPIGQYSSGLRQRVKLALATLFEPPVLLLDEAGLALDSKGVTLVAELVAEQQQRGGLTLIATNDSREAALAQRVIAL
jgi:heme exporter protein A